MSSEWDIRPLFSCSSSKSSVVQSSTPPLSLRSKRSATDSPRTSVSDEKTEKSNLASELIEDIDCHIKEVRTEGTADSQLAGLMIAEVDAEIYALRPELEGVGEQQQTIDVSNNIPLEAQELLESENPIRTLVEAKTRLQRFETSYDYLTYSNDLIFRQRFSERHPQLSLIRAEGRIAAFEGSDEYRQYLKVLGFILRQGDENDLAAVCENEIVKEKQKKQRAKGRLSKAWGELGIRKR